jgi:hypothetical protein
MYIIAYISDFVNIPRTLLCTLVGRLYKNEIVSMMSYALFYVTMITVFIEKF